MIPDAALHLIQYLTTYVTTHAPDATVAIAGDRGYQTALKQFDAAVLAGDATAVKAIGNAIARRVQHLCKEATAA